MQKRAALGLPMDVLVVIILSLVILMGGIALLYKFISGADQIKTDLDQRTEQELLHLLVQEGQQVALPFNHAIIPRGKTHVFGIGILNVDNEAQEFEITVQLAKVTDEANEDFTSSVDKAEVLKWLLYEKDRFSLPENDHREEVILVNVPSSAITGTYVFHARIKEPNGQQYGILQQFSVSVV